MKKDTLKSPVRNEHRGFESAARGREKKPDSTSQLYSLGVRIIGQQLTSADAEHISGLRESGYDRGGC